MVATDADADTNAGHDPIRAGSDLSARDDRPLDERAALAWCERYAKRQYENFTVVSWFLPKRRRASIYGLYAFCRFTDDLGDEAGGDRLAHLEEWERDLERGFAGEGRHPIMVALGGIARRHPLSIDSCRRLIEANRRDQRQRRYETYPGCAGVLRLLRQPGGADGAVAVRPHRRRAPGSVRRDLHGAAAGQPLAGRVTRLRDGAALPAARGPASLRGERRADRGGALRR